MPSPDTAVIVLAAITLLAAFVNGALGYGFSSLTVPVALALFPGVFEVPWGDIAAASILASLPPIVIAAAISGHCREPMPITTQVPPLRTAA